jgi:hypothetical protein
MFEFIGKDDAMCSRQSDTHQQLMRARAFIDEYYDLPLDLETITFRGLSSTCIVGDS